ncbi:hypothetical protein [Streptomyces griseus]|uniref:hypothetical protein n=1 Tax=Streptomyces griseus TaxID=1911 RepID=UPI0007C6CB8A|nr:hypothetical protein [Streptomyces griseus]
MLPAEAGGFKVGLEALTTFKNRVDDVLSTFEGSPASSQKIGAHTLSEASFVGGGGFGEAKGLHAQYERVHERLTALSKTLGLQIEAIQIAVQGAHGDFTDVDEEQRRRFWEIQTHIGREQAEAEREKKAAEAAKQGKSAEERSSNTKAGTEGGGLY